MRFLSRCVAIALAVWGSYSAHAQTEITLIAPGGIRAAIEQLIPGFEQKTGYKVKATFGSGLGTCPSCSRRTPRCWHPATWWQRARGRWRAWR